MDAGTLLLIAIGLLAMSGIIFAGYWLDRRGQRAESAAWMKAWAIRNRAIADLYRRWKGPLRLADQSAKPARQPRKRKVALPRRSRKRSTKG